LALGDFSSTPTLRNNLAWIHWHRGELDLARRLYEANVAQGSATLRAIGCAKLIEIHAQQQRPEAMRRAIDQGLLAVAATEPLWSRVAVVISVLHHGSDADVQRAPAFLPATPPSDEWSRARPAAALAARGVDPPAVG